MSDRMTIEKAMRNVFGETSRIDGSVRIVFDPITEKELAKSEGFIFGWDAAVKACAEIASNHQVSGIDDEGSHVLSMYPRLQKEICEAILKLSSEKGTA